MWREGESLQSRRSSLSSSRTVSLPRPTLRWTRLEEVRAARLGLAGRLAASPARARRMVARMVVSRDMVLDVVRGGRQPARDGELFKGCAASVPRGEKAGRPTGLGCKWLLIVGRDASISRTNGAGGAGTRCLETSATRVGGGQNPWNCSSARREAIYSQENWRAGDGRGKAQWAIEPYAAIVHNGA